ncbi:MAG: class I SAM-dependent methyltransferase [Sporichthyaceae bacterium]
MTQPGSAAERAAAMKRAISAAFDNSADSYEQVGVEFFARFGAELARRAQAAPGEKVLDLGCGRGHVLFPIAAAIGEAGLVVGTDLSARMVELCALEAAERGLIQASVEVGDAAAPAFPPGSFDVVTAGMVMFFVPDPRSALRAVLRVLRPGGRLAMSSFGPSDPKFAETMAILYRHRVGEPWEDNPDRPFDSSESIAAMLEEAGFLEVDVVEDSCEIVFSSADHYWAWVGSHGGRIMIDEVGPERLPAAKAEVYAMLAPHADASGALRHSAITRYATARTPC